MGQPKLLPPMPLGYQVSPCRYRTKTRKKQRITAFLSWNAVILCSFAEKKEDLQHGLASVLNGIFSGAYYSPHDSNFFFCPFFFSVMTSQIGY